MKKKHIFSGAALVALSIFAAGCSSDDTTPAYEDNNTLTTFTGGSEDGEDPTAGSATRSSMRVEELREEGAPDNALTRTTLWDKSGDYYGLHNEIIYKWATDDQIYVKDDTGFWNKSMNKSTGGLVNKFDFLLTGVYLKSDSYLVRYVGRKSPNATTVIIQKDQVVAGNPSDLRYIGLNGDYAVGTATKVSQGKYNFTVTHKASYLRFVPYASTREIFDNYYMQKITVTSNATDIAGTYTLSENGSLTNGRNLSKTITLDESGYTTVVIPSDVVEQSGVKNYEISGTRHVVVIVPGTHTLTVTYTMVHKTNGTTTTVTKKYKSKEFKENTVYNVISNMG